MKRLIIYFLILLGAIWLGVIIYKNPGYILVVYQKWAIESTIWFLGLFLIVSFFILYALINLIKHTKNLPARIGQWWRNKKRDKAIKRLVQGYNDFLSHKFPKAEKKIRRSGKVEQLKEINYLIAAQIAQAQGNAPKRDAYLAKTDILSEKNNYIVNIMRSKFYLENNQLDLALACLKKLQLHFPRDAYLQKLLADAYIAQGNALELQKLLPQLKKNPLYKSEDFLKLERTAYLKQFTQFSNDFTMVQIWWNKMPHYLRHDPYILIAYATHLYRTNRSKEAGTLIRRELRKKFNPDLAQFYIKEKSDEPAKQLALAQEWLAKNPNDLALLKAIGHLCLVNRLWGKARDYFEASLKIQPNPEVYSVLGYIYEKLGEPDRALQCYRKGAQAFM